MAPHRTTLTKIKAAQIQLERAITLYLDDADFVSAITLAGAAEEILGKLLANAGRQTILENSAIAVSEFNVALESAPIAKRDAIAEMNSARDALKHIGNGNEFTFDFQEEAYELIDRAISNLLQLTQQVTPNTARFYSMKATRGI